MPATKIESGAELDIGILGSDVDVIPYECTGTGGPYTKAAVVAEIPGSFGQASEDAPNAVLVRKRYGGFMSVEKDGSWSALGLAIYRSNNPFDGASRAFSAYARRLASLELPVYRAQATVDENGAGTAYVRYPRVIQRPSSGRVKLKLINGITEDDFCNKVDPLVGAIFRFVPNGQPYILVGADGNFTAGAPLRAEYRFFTTGSVPAFAVDSGLRNDIAIPALGPLGEYAEYISTFDNKPVVTVANASQLYIEADLSKLPGF